MGNNADKLLGLAPATLHILLALAGEDLHGYGIMQEVAFRSGGHHKLGPGTLYYNLQRLTDQGLVQEVVRPTRRASSEDSRRRYYRLTSQGRSVLSAEVKRLERVVRDARRLLQSPKLGRA